MAGEYVDLRYERDTATNKMSGIRGDILDAMDRIGQTNLVAGDYSVVVARPTSAVLDEQGLRDELDDDMWDKITSTVVDRNKLDAYIKAGEVDVDVVARNTTYVEKGASLRITAKR